MAPMPDDDRIAREAAKEKWYYSIELRPGLLTQGMNHANIVPVRMALAATEIRGMRCLDIGTQDGLVPVLMSRRGAAYVAAQDIVDRKAKIDLLKESLGIEFDYLGGQAMEGLRSALRSRGKLPLDVTVFSGVLYHMIDPFFGLAVARSLVRTGGVLIVETMAAIDKSMVMHFNAGRRYNNDSGSYFMLSTACLDYMLRLLRLKPIDCTYTQPYTQSGLALSRVCVVSRAVDAPVLGPDDTWAPARHHFDALMDWEELNEVSAPVDYTPVNHGCIKRSDTGTVDIHETIMSSPAVDLAQPGLVRLGIDDLY